MKKLKTAREKRNERRIIRTLEVTFGLGLIGTVILDVLKRRDNSNDNKWHN